MRISETREGNLRLWSTLTIKPAWLPAVDAMIDKLVRFREAYSQIAAHTGVPWFIVAVIDALEAGGGANRHLFNGDSLAHRTVNDPKGQPVVGAPPFTFFVSAVAALEHDGFTSWKDWSVSGTLFMLEAYNGWGYRKAGRPPSPYLWSGSTAYSKGKFTSDHGYSSSAVSDQVGAALLLWRMVGRALISMEVK